MAPSSLSRARIGAPKCSRPGVRLSQPMALHPAAAGQPRVNRPVGTPVGWPAAAGASAPLPLAEARPCPLGPEPPRGALVHAPPGVHGAPYAPVAGEDAGGDQD